MYMQFSQFVNRIFVERGKRSSAFRSVVFGMIAVVVVALFASTIVSAQVETGQISGVVADQSGAVIPGAAVTIKNLATNTERKTVSSATGAYQVPGLTPSKYLITVDSPGFQSYKANVEVTVGSKIAVDVKLSVSTSTTEVDVIAEGGVAVNTQTQEMSQVVNTQQMALLPSLTRNPYDFVNLSGNVSGGDNTGNSAGSGQNSTNRGVGVSINGQRQSGTEILLDGVENVDVFNAGVGENIPVDGVQEYSVITNNFSAEYGRASGGVVNVTTKPGSNQIHGAAWEYNRLSAYTANTYDNVVNGMAKGTYTRNQFGFQIGGPILHNKLFATATTEYLHVRSSANMREEVFNPDFIAMMPSNAKAYFAQYGQGVYHSSGTSTTAGQLGIGATGANPMLINGATPIPDGTPVFDSVAYSAPFDAGGDNPQNTYSVVGRLDYTLSEKTEMFFRAARENVDKFLGAASYSAYPQYNVGEVTLNQSYLYSLSHTFTTNLFGSAKLSFTRFDDANSFDTALTYTPSLMFVQPTDPVTHGFIQMPGLENSGSPGSGGLPYGGPQNTIQFEPDFSWTKGNHSMRFGGIYTYLQVNRAYGAYAQAVEQLGSTFTTSMQDLLNTASNPGGSQLTSFSARVNPQGKLPCHTDVYGNPLPDPSCMVQPPLDTASFSRSYRYKDWAVYAQDNYKLTPKLTLNYGLRYEHYGVQHNNNQSLDSNFYYGSGSSLEAQVRNGGILLTQKSSQHGFWAPRWGTLAPRVGFAYDLRGNGKTSVRGGFGISYERNFGNVTFNASFNPPASAVVALSCSAANQGCPVNVTNDNRGPLGLPGPASALPPSSIRMPDPNIQVAQTQFWSFALQQQVATGTIAELSYSGAHGVHLYDIENINQAGAAQVYLGDPLVADPVRCTNFANLDTLDGECLTRPNNQYSDINLRGSRGVSSYQAFNAKVQTQNLHNTGLTVSANYTWAHSLDNLSSTFGDGLQGGSGVIGTLGYTSIMDPMLDWGSSDFDVRHRLAISPIWETPWFKTGKGLKRQALGGWTFSGLYTVHTGIPFSAFDYSTDENYYTVPRLIPRTPITNYHVSKNPTQVDANLFNALTIPLPMSWNALNPALGISDFGPFPLNMTRRNSFRGPGAWNADVAMVKSFKLTEKIGMEFRAEGFNIFNHHNMYVDTTNLAYQGQVLDTATGNMVDPDPIFVSLKKGGLGTGAAMGNHDERRFGQFAMKVSF